MTYTTSQIASFLGLSTHALRLRARRRGMTKKKIGTLLVDSYLWSFSADDVKALSQYIPRGYRGWKRNRGIVPIVERWV